MDEQPTSQVIPNPITPNVGVPTRVVTTLESNGDPHPTTKTTVTQVALNTSTTLTNSPVFIFVALTSFALTYLAFAGVLVWRIFYLTVYFTPANAVMLQSTLDTVKQMGSVSTIVLGTVILGKDITAKLQGLFLK